MSDKSVERFDRRMGRSPRSLRLRLRKERSALLSMSDTPNDPETENDPIDCSLKLRIKRGGLESQVNQDLCDSKDEKLFDLKWKAPQIIE